MAWGLGCASDADCLGGAPCAGGTCQPPSLQGLGRACSHDGSPCVLNSDCGDPEATCADPARGVVAPLGLDHLVDGKGRPIRVEIHAIDIDAEGDGNAMIALQGGGQHFQVRSTDPEDFLAKILRATDIKTEELCLPED